MPTQRQQIKEDHPEEWLRTEELASSQLKNWFDQLNIDTIERKQILQNVERVYKRFPSLQPDFAIPNPDKLLHLISEFCISLSEAAKITGYHEDYLGQRARLGQLKAVKIGRNWLTHRSCLDDFSKNHAGPHAHWSKNLSPFGKKLRQRKKRKKQQWNQHKL